MSRAHSSALLTGVALALGAACAPSAGRNGVTLRFWALGTEGERVQPLVRDFERENPGIRVRVQQIPWTAAHEKLLTAYVGDAMPDVAQLGNTWIAEFGAIGALEQLDSRVSRSSVVRPASYFRGAWDGNVVSGRTYGVPWYVDTRLLFYRTDLLRRAGYAAIPDAWAGWLRAMQAIQRQQGRGRGRYAIFLPTNEWAQPVILGMQAGSPLLTAGGRYGAFSQPAFRRGFEFYVELFRRRLAPVAGNNDVANVYQEFARGTFAMYPTGPWNIGEFRRRLPDSLQQAWSAAPFPGPTGDSSGTSLAGGSSLVIFRASPRRDAAWRLVEYLSRPEQQLRFARLTGDLPARIDAWNDSSLLGDPIARAFYVQLQRARPLPQVPEMELIASRVIEASESVIRGGTPVPSALAALDRDVNHILEKRRWLLARDSARRAGGQ